METIDHLVECVALGVELLAVAIVVIASIFGTGRFLFHLHKKSEAAYVQYKVHLGKALLLSLELMVAADIIETVALTPTFESVAALGLLVVIRTLLSWTITIEIEERLPWRPKGNEEK